MPREKKTKLKLKKTLFNRTLLLTASTLILGTILALGLQIVLAQWKGPILPPPNGITTGTFLDTSTNPQTKAGSLIVEGGLQVGTSDIPASVNIQGGLTTTEDLHGDNAYAYFQDVYLSRANKLAGDPFIFNYNCQDVPSGNCQNVNLTNVAGDDQASDKNKYVMVGVDSTNQQVICCRPPAVALVLPPSPMIVTTSIDLIGTCSQGQTLYQGKVTIQVNYYDPATAETLDAVQGVTIKGKWLSPITSCADGNTTCTATTDAKGIVTILSAPIVGTDAYGKNFQFQRTYLKHGSDFVQVYNPTDNPISVNLANPGKPMNIHIASINVISTLSYAVDAFHRYALAEVKVVNEAEKPISGLPVVGRWSGSYTSTADETVVSGQSGVLPSDYTPGTSPAFENDVLLAEDGVAKFVTKGVYCWQEYQSSGKLNFTFIAKDVINSTLSCPAYQGIYNYCYPVKCCSPNCAVSPPTETTQVSICTPPDIVYWPFGPAPHYWAWGENIGWLKFKSTQPYEGSWGVLVSKGCLEGYAWAENIGWINLGDGSPRGVANGCQYTGSTYSNSSASDFGVNNDGYGNLSGYAWGENVGWINFTGVKIFVDTATLGKLQDYAWGENIGWIHFDYDTNYSGYNPWIYDSAP